MITKRRILAWFLCISLVLSTAVLGHAYSNILAFGDSLSDNGYYQGYPGGTLGNTNPYDIYGFQRFSDGPVWVEYLALNYGVLLFDMAYGGATTGVDNPYVYDITDNPIYQTTTGLQWQVADYTGTYGPISSDTLITVWAGANDMFNYSSDPVQYGPSAAAANIAEAIDDLIASGGRNFIVPNLTGTNQESSVMQTWIDPFNSALALYLQELDEIPCVNIYAIDLTQFFYEGLNPEGSVLEPGDEEGPFARYDSIHPSTLAHAQIASYIASQVPEPVTVILLGFGLIGLAGFRRKV